MLRVGNVLDELQVGPEQLDGLMAKETVNVFVGNAVELVPTTDSPPNVTIAWYTPVVRDPAFPVKVALDGLPGIADPEA